MGALRGKLLLMLFVLAFAIPSFGGSIDLDFEKGAVAAGGVITILGGGTDATGMDIPVSVLTVSGDGAMDGTYQVTGTCMGAGCLTFGGGTISIEGAVPIFGDLTSPMTLLSGTVLLDVTAALGGGYHIVLHGSDVKSSVLMADLGMPDLTGALFTGSVITGSSAGRDGTYQAISTDIRNTMTPEPVSMLLMGTFLTMAGGLLSRKKRA